MTSPVVDKIRRLLERAAHEGTPVEEARTSAVIAAKLIVEHKVELRAPGDAGIWTPPAGIDIGDIGDLFNEIFGYRRRARPSPPSPPPPPVTRTMYTASCPAYLHLRCSCCGSPVRVGTTFGWVDGRDLIASDAEGNETIARVVHESCQQHWQQRVCSACGKDTHKPRNLREKIRNHRREPPGTTRATSTGFCHCCGNTYDVDDKVVQRGFVFVHLKCSQHFTTSPCPKCGGGARF